ncbi:hypothetical protein NQ318_018869 [Aromia moschata]|uniref:Uncharacterized protein n=1 Tax=Aromia moschata TaxID=1265417 RepID=A0AAV8ZG49_9CUCU|nr:hypothetical protein NQ318_018869 [Aromia moschata]
MIDLHRRNEGLEHFEELLVTYYNSFSDFLKSLGGDPEKLFPFSALRVHWRKYSLFGLISALSILRFMVCDKEDAPELADLAEGQNMGDFLYVNLKNRDLYYERLRPVVRHYFSPKF